MANVVIEHLTKLFSGPDGEEIRAVQDLSLSIGAGELVVLVGPSGCGKTTTLRLLAGLERATSGTISIDGETVTEKAPKDRDVAMVFQSPALYPHLSAHENLAFGLKIRRVGREEREQRVLEVAQVLGLSECLGRRPAELSGGQRQRMALGRALVRRPKLLLLDEPLSNLDAPLRGQMRLELLRIHERLGTTMVYVTHDQAEAMTMGQRVAVLKAGRLQQLGEPLEVYERPANVFVAGFFGWPAMNFFKGRITQNGFEVSSGKGLGLRLDGATVERLSGHAGKPLILGLRPEDIRLQNGLGGERENRIAEAQVEFIERDGAETLLHLRGNGLEFVAREGQGSRVLRGTNVPVVFDVSRAHFFEEDGGRVD